MGLETEYGCLVAEGEQGHLVVGKLRDWFFDNDRHGLIDVHQRDWDEPPGNGGFLFNGGRVYEDMGHLEMCTPECASALDVVHYDRSNDQMIDEALRELHLTDTVSIIRNNIDHYTGATFGCHENFSMLRQVELSDESVFSLLTFLTLRGLYTGAGRVGGLEMQRQQVGEGLLKAFKGFQITQRADYVENDFYRWVQGNRAIINTRDKPLADPILYRRLHLLHGDTNVLPSATFLKLGATSLALDLLETDLLPKVQLFDPVRSLKEISYQTDGPWEVILKEGVRADSIDVLDQFHQAAYAEFAGRDSETDQILTLWRRVNEGLRNDATSLMGVLDWVSKRILLEDFCEQEGLTLQDPWMESQDLEYHQVLSDRSLGLPLAEAGPWLASSDTLAPYLKLPPQDTRAVDRSSVMKRIRPAVNEYMIDWDRVRWGDQLADLSDPYAVTAKVQSAPEQEDFGEMEY